MTNRIALEEFKSVPELFDTVSRADGPVTITKDGHDFAVCMSAGTYKDLQDEIDRAKLCAIIEESVADFEAGHATDASELSARLRTQYGF